jgi:hypothetical protein
VRGYSPHLLQASIVAIRASSSLDRRRQRLSPVTTSTSLLVTIIAVAYFNEHQCHDSFEIVISFSPDLLCEENDKIQDGKDRELNNGSQIATIFKNSNAEETETINDENPEKKSTAC